MEWSKGKMEKEIRVLVDGFIKESKKEKETVTTDDVRSLVAMVVLEVLSRVDCISKGGV